MSLSEHDREAIADVAAFCSTDSARRALACVHLDEGWAMGSDSYRADLREVDDPRTVTLNPFNGRPFTPKGVGGLPLRVARVMKSMSPKGLHLQGRVLQIHELPPKKRGTSDYAWCFGCQAYGDTGLMWDCGCEPDAAPLVNLGYLRGAMAGADAQPVQWLWTDALRPVRYVEPEHIHCLMPIRRPGAYE